jgi:F5/8 type C domain
VVPTLTGVAHAAAPTPQIPGSVAAPSASEVSPICDAPDPSSVLGPETTLPSDPTTTVVTPSGGVSSFSVTSSNLYVNTGSALDTYSLTGSLLRSFSLPGAFASSKEPSEPVVDPSGNIYLSSNYGQIVDKFSSTGSLLWSVDPHNGSPEGLFGITTGSGFELAVSIVQDTSASDLLDLSTGAVDGSFPLVDDGYVTQESDGNFLYSQGGYVETVSPSGTVLSKFGSSVTQQNGAHTGAGFEFSNGGQAVQGPDGTIYTSDPKDTFESTSPTGDLLATTTFGGNLQVGSGGFYLVGSTLYFQGGPVYNDAGDNISSIPLPTLSAELSAVHRPYDTLGWGAGLTTGATGNYFPAGTTPSVDATFDSWWSEQASHLSLQYSVENTASLDAETVPAGTTLSLPTSAASLASIPLTLPAADQVPGPYLVQASLFDTSTSPPTRLGTTCLPYTVGATGDGLDFATLPSGAGGGGPSDPRGVALNAQLGLDGFRGASVNWSTFLPNCSASAPTAATCSSSAMDFSEASTSYYQAAATALADHVTYWVQVSNGDSLSMALVNSGYWQGDIAALVAHYSTVPAGCSPCAPVTKWEPWNESNNTGWSNAADYVSKVLAPFYAAVKSVLPGSASTVIGGSTIDVAYSWWQQLVAAGGLADMDVAAIHPYTGSNDSFEEDGKPAQIEQLEALLAGKPLWFTEVGWWNDGDYNFLAQADDVTRAMLWQKALSIPVWNYFYDEGNWGNWGVSFSLIQAGSVDDYVKPAALAAMTTSNQVAARPYLGMPSTGIPQTYQALFGPDGTSPDRLDAVWSDGLSTTGSVTFTAPGGGSIPVSVTTEYGQSTEVSVTSGTPSTLPIGGQVTYLAYPAGDTVALSPTETFGADLAAASSGGKATASSGNPSAAIAGLPAGYGNGWTSADGDTTPSLTVTLASAATLNRIVVDTQSAGSVATGVRDYTLSVDEPGTGWKTVATEVGQYRDHEELFAFSPVLATAVRISVTEVDFGGYFGGGIPPWWSPTEQGNAFIHALQVYAGTDSVDQVDGTGLTPLTGQDPPPPPPTTTTTTTTTPTTTPDPPPGQSGEKHPAQLPTSQGYWVTTTNGNIYTFGSVPFYGSALTSADAPVVGMVATADNAGYRMVTNNGGVFTFGDAGFYGSTGSLVLNKPIVGMADTGDDNGYWLVGSDGGVFSFGDAAFYGSTGSLVLNEPIVGMESTPDGKGYWLVAADGGIFAYGDAGFYGSTGSLVLNEPIVGMAATPDGHGYWLVASDGGIFAFGDAGFYGSTGSLVLDKPITGMQSTPDGKGYWLVASDGGIFAFGDAGFYGSASDDGLSAPAIAIS